MRSTISLIFPFCLIPVIGMLVIHETYAPAVRRVIPSGILRRIWTEKNWDHLRERLSFKACDPNRSYGWRASKLLRKPLYQRDDAARIYDKGSHRGRVSEKIFPSKSAQEGHPVQPPGEEKALTSGSF